MNTCCDAVGDTNVGGIAFSASIFLEVGLIFGLGLGGPPCALFFAFCLCFNSFFFFFLAVAKFLC